jgi:uncharacterized protein (UPF0335 family)
MIKAAITHCELKSIVSRIEQINAELENGNADKAEIFKEAKNGGFDVKVLKKVIQLRAASDDERQKQLELDSMVEVYLMALSGQNAIDTHASLNSVAANGFEANLHPARGRVGGSHDPLTGEIDAQEKVAA